MIIARSMGVWMNHSFANLIEYTTGLITSVTIDCKVDRQYNESGFATNETKIFFKEQNINSAYLKDLESALHNCKELILFGPNYSKINLYYNLRKNNLFANTRIKITHTENMDENQQHEFVKGHFMVI